LNELAEIFNNRRSLSAAGGMLTDIQRVAGLAGRERCGSRGKCADALGDAGHSV